MLPEREAKTAPLSFFSRFCPVSGLILLLVSPIHIRHQILDPIFIWISADSPLFFMLRPHLHQKHNGTDVAITICFLHPVTFNAFLWSWFHPTNIAKAAVAIGALCQTQVHAGEEQKKEESLELHDCCCCCSCCSLLSLNISQNVLGEKRLSCAACGGSVLL